MAVICLVGIVTALQMACDNTVRTVDVQIQGYFTGQIKMR